MSTVGDPGDLFAIDRRQLGQLMAVASRLLTIDRLTGDDMRDLGKTVDGIARSTVDMGPIPAACSECGKVIL